MIPHLLVSAIASIQAVAPAPAPERLFQLGCAPRQTRLRLHGLERVSCRAGRRLGDAPNLVRGHARWQGRSRRWRAEKPSYQHLGTPQNDL